MITGSKTEAGKDRIIPIHKTIQPFIVELLNAHDDYLIIPGSTPNANQYYRNHYFSKLMDRLNMNHTPYDTRHTFSTLAKLYKTDEFTRKRIMGHKSLKTLIYQQFYFL